MKKHNSYHTVKDLELGTGLNTKNAGRLLTMGKTHKPIIFLSNFKSMFKTHINESYGRFVFYDLYVNKNDLGYPGLLKEKDRMLMVDA
ncbi:MAG: hypothetical protein LBF68_05095 [Christensenellaceae bacterium]|nr:hypothetical protein [Christensenellaceae bacterium]